MLDLVYTPASVAADLALRLMLLIFGGAIAVHMLCACNFARRAPHWLKSGILVPAVGAGVAMMMGSLTGQIAWALQGALAAACLLVLLSIAQWWYGLRTGDLFDRAMAIQAGENPPELVHKKAPFEMRVEVHAAARRVMAVLCAISVITGAAMLTGLPQIATAQLLDDAPAIGQHGVQIDPGDETTQPGGQLWARWNVERLRICETGLRTWVVDSAGVEHVLDLRINAPSRVKQAQPGFVDTYKRSYTLPKAVAPGPAYITASVWHACNPVRSALRVYKHIYYERAHFFIKPL